MLTMLIHISEKRDATCDYSNPYICGYRNHATMTSVKWDRVLALDINDGIGPSKGHAGSVLGKQHLSEIVTLASRCSPSCI